MNGFPGVFINTSFFKLVLRVLQISAGLKIKF